jgi:hypothetical protein
VSVVDAEFGADMILADGTTSKLGALTNKLNLFFTVSFTVELLINAYANWFRRLIRNGYICAHDFNINKLACCCCCCCC